VIGRWLGKLVALPIKVIAVPFRVIDRAVGVDDNGHQVTPGTMLRGGAKAVERAIEEAIDE
jgi:hypothetical protein